ncbi:MAG: Lrp/AsnC family transcriptional regulator [Sedimenticola sp.]|nr:Lrp/AsnC family transcriptional regulator [Sedimenticola sp.]
MTIKLDKFDRLILHHLQEDARLSHVALSERINLYPSQCARRLQQLEKAGVIRGYTAVIDPQALGMDVVALINITLEKHQENIAAAFEKAVQERPEILECLLITGDGDYEMRVIAKNLQGFSRFISEHLMKMPGVSSIKSNIQLSQIKARAALPLLELDC